MASISSFVKLLVGHSCARAQPCQDTWGRWAHPTRLLFLDACSGGRAATTWSEIAVCRGCCNGNHGGAALESLRNAVQGHSLMAPELLLEGEVSLHLEVVTTFAIATERLD
jgi:hypothetical protein